MKLWNQTFKKSQITQNRSFWNTKYESSPKTERVIQTNLGDRIKTLEQNLKNEEDFNAYNLCKLELENIYDKKAEGAEIRSKCEFYQDG